MTRDDGKDDDDDHVVVAVVESPRERVPFSTSPPQILSIAGSDPSGGAGIQADLKTFASLGCYGMAALTALTAQSTTGVSSIHVTPADFFREQLQCLWQDVEVDAVKIGMLANQEIVRATHEELRDVRLRGAQIVLDPVMVSTSGSLLLTDDAINDVVHLLLPQCTLLTPNIPEAEQLLRHSGQSQFAAAAKWRLEDDLMSLMQATICLARLGPKAVLVKGGHCSSMQETLETDLERIGLSKGEEAIPDEKKFLGADVFITQWRRHKVTVVRTDQEPFADILRSNTGARSPPRVVTDILFEGQSETFWLFVKPFVESRSTHGTGCTLSSACAAHLAMTGGETAGDGLASSVFTSIQYVQRAIARGLRDFGRGNGPLNHLCCTFPRPILAPAENEAAPLCSRFISHSLPIWRAFVQHPFVKQLVSLSLPHESFVYFLRQDYLFLRHYARVWASGASSFTSGSTFQRIASFAKIAATMADEAEHHVKICEPWGITRRDLEAETVESAATLAYTRFVLDVSRSGDALELLAATGPCMLGYGEAGRYAAKEQKRLETLDGGRTDVSKMHADGFQHWIDYYSGDDFQSVVRDGIAGIERSALEDPPSTSRIESLQRIWDAAIRLEIGMWDEALNPSLRREIYK